MDINYLISNGIDINSSIDLLGGMDIYNEILNTFLNEIDDKFNKICKFKEANDMTNYSILVHSLKSDSKYLGFTQLAKLSYDHEINSKENNIEYIYNNFDELESELNRVINIMRGVVSNKRTVLVVDDSNIIRNFAVKCLENNYTVLTASNGFEAIDVVKNNDINAVLLDLNMPECNGFDVLNYFKENNLFDKIPVSLLTGDDTKESIDKAFTYKIVDMLSKPFNEESINAIVNKTMQVHKID